MSNQINWMEEVLKRKEQIIHDTQVFLQIKSVLDEDGATELAPLGHGIDQALKFMLNKGQNDGFSVKNVGGLAGHIEYGEGTELLGILCHVDVVPEGDGWTSDPYSAEIRDGKIFARGAIDDKGPTMAAYYAMKIVKELGLTVQKRVRMILGTDEESNWRCVDHYFKHEEMPTIGFAPDADFPIINAEKGIFDFILEQKGLEQNENSGTAVLEMLQAGRRLNMVPDLAEASIQCRTKDSAEQIKYSFEQYIKDNTLTGAVIIKENNLQLRLEGISAHGMEPNKGRNAGLLLNSFLYNNLLDVLDPKTCSFVSFVQQYFGGDTRGKALGIAYADEISGELTINNGTLSYSKEKGGKIGLNLRYPVTHDIEPSKQKIKEVSENHNFTCKELSDSKPHHVDQQHPLIKVLQMVYEEQTGEKAELIAIGGGTYARSLRAGVAFGPLFPGRPDVAHQKDEYIEIEDLLKATAIYAQAIYELAK
ncbi:dipeptidase PepV [Schinkia azotoformans]|uniref:Dipeptidase n=1 Tax=Schinkia azotoformans LMG 9581 TaxID=1131731 RepID=K6D494_SCHAZ|nr:dipeptidase PepV [Schinkia azotoformans]EKN62878.1 dipeptidase [Schinkia azotoformans LMG 9581]MEC1641073.1 dipeptidase PepV [Schinkia azotoformans]MEC1945085.1 dipeptidase PepV [Schinkia azotoformans]